MEDLAAYRRQHRWDLLLKEIDQIHSTIKNLDDIVFKTKNFGFVFWGGSLYLIVLQGEKDIEGKRFPFFDVVGWTYTKTAEGKTGQSFLDEYLINPDEFRGWMVISYKDVKWFYGTMFVVSMVLGAIHIIVL